MREYLLEVVESIKPSFMGKAPHFNFITAHYFWIISATIIASVLLYGPGQGNLAYIDALFLATGANTQAGLNTVDINLLNTFQQVVIYLFAMLSNPITINSTVLFLRLYWFEKKFQTVVKEARSRRGTITKTRSKARPETTDPERGVNGRHITIMRNPAELPRMANDGSALEAINESGKEDSAKNGSQSGEDVDPLDDATPPAKRPEHHHVPQQIKFADQVNSSDHSAIVDEDEDEEEEEDDERMPQQRTTAEHIAILERQRKEDEGVLRIPGPRDAERGALPEELDRLDSRSGEDHDRASRRRRESSLESPRRLSPKRRTQSNTTGERPHTITITEPEHPRREEIAENVEAAVHAAGALKPRKPRLLGEKSGSVDGGLAGSRPIQKLRSVLSQTKDHEMPYLTWEPTMGRNSAFLGLTEEQREELGGIEYRSLKTLVWVVTCYFWGWSIVGVIGLLPWILVNNDVYGSIVDAAGQSRVWWAFFTSNTSFMDLGFTLTPDSMNSFNTAIWPLLLMSFLIVIGNTGFPVMLRITIWICSLLTPKGSGLWEEFRFLLDHPRRCFTLLFPSTATWWLFFILVALNGIDLIFFVILDLGAGPIGDLPLNIRFLDGWFQAVSTRTAGLSCVNLAYLHPAVQTSYLIMMYISAFPIAITIRRTNVYEERSLGIYSTMADVDDSAGSAFSYVGAHLRRQLSFDLWYIFVGFFILSISEGARLQTNDISMFAVLFELVSAYGTVGMSLGYATVNASLSSQFSVVGKLVIIAMQIRGRHRGLPYGLDRAVLLPGESLERKDAQDAEERLQRRQSAISLAQGAPNAFHRRSLSVDRPSIITQFLHPGPVVPSISIARTEASTGYGRTETLKRTTTEPPMDEPSEGFTTARPELGRRRTEIPQLMDHDF